MKNIYELIELISTRTAMYTGECKLSNVRSFLDGYTFAVENETTLIDFLSNFQGFHDWVAKKFGFYESTAGWQNMILAIEIGLSPTNIKWEGYSCNVTEEQHRSSVIRFFELVKEYKNA
ncbi:hypothetical protein ACQE3E_03925 [Methylomonas sp. MED-D]|uniref:Uncharacterized protein n=1 Tax=Methylomonas koyamae TaxID=702114 RepID=A0A177N3A2_9GAMM|nr:MULTISPECIES: hypothetical protein [Methylomonas]ANE56093.1 hypothetical protein AYM39_13495 [Methylomonas sp. DH-1]MDT4329943.1 hypothetical protein [Methylomonas sp. MV1]OAI12446.1 hypothetical protein A1507_02900 [Methylomonas koyamae]OHX35987.1 hypothetical protein BJL95_02805 [Methylomonas sp. LWB]